MVALTERTHCFRSFCYVHITSDTLFFPYSCPHAIRFLDLLHLFLILTATPGSTVALVLRIYVKHQAQAPKKVRKWNILSPHDAELLSFDALIGKKQSQNMFCLTGICYAPLLFTTNKPFQAFLILFLVFPSANQLELVFFRNSLLQANRIQQTSGDDPVHTIDETTDSIFFYSFVQYFRIGSHDV